MKRVWIIGAMAALGLLVLVFYDQVPGWLHSSTSKRIYGWVRGNTRPWEGDYDLSCREQELPFKLRIHWDDGARLRITSGQLVIDLHASLMHRELAVKGTDGVWSEFELLPNYNSQSEVIGFGIKGTDLHARRTSFVREEPPSWLTDDR